MKASTPRETRKSSRYDPANVIRHFNDYGVREWERLVQSPADEVNLYIHVHYLEKYICKDKRVLEIGAGAGRFTQILARLGAQVLVADISAVQLELNKHFALELGFDRAVIDRQQVDICDLSRFGSNSFDCVVAYGGPFSYVLEKRDLALSECRRVLRPGGILLLSVMSLWGTVHARLEGVLSIPAATNRRIIRTGDISPATFPERRSNYMHLFRASELVQWLKQKKLKIVDISASSSLCLTWNDRLTPIRSDAKKWNELLRMEVEACADPGCLNMGTHLIAAAQKR